MKNIEYLVGSPDVLTNDPLPVYNDEVVEFLSIVSKSLMKSPALRQYSDISALAFWCRKANLQKLKHECVEAGMRLGRGLCFHIAPGNIPINFAFSYIFGLLAGCSNLVRLSSKDYPQISPICSVISDALSSYPEIKKRTAFVRYDADDEITSIFCRNADARIIWGGDETVNRIKAMPTKPRCVDVCFADRYSVCVINGNEILAANDSLLSRLADDFYNDTYLMDQNACSSEQMIFWQNDSEEARTRFWDKVYTVAEKKYQLQPAISVDKYTQMFEDILDGKSINKMEMNSNLLYRVELKSLEGDITESRGKGGYFYEYSIGNLKDIVPFVTDKFQTLTYFGFSPDLLREFIIKNRLRGIDRIVPIGKAMDIGIIWDGFDLVRMLSRYVDKS